MPLFYHYTSHDSAKSIREDGQIIPSPGFYDRIGVWMTKKDPGHTKEEILLNNYEYNEFQALRNISRAACYVKIHLPHEKVEDLSYRRKAGNDLWTWPEVNGPLVLASFNHDFGVMEGNPDLYLRNKVMEAAKRAYDASSITRALRRIEYDRSLTEECRDEKMTKVWKMFKKIVTSKYHIIAFDATDTIDRDHFILTQQIGLFLCDYVVSDNSFPDDPEILFDKFLDTCAVTYTFLGFVQ